MRMREPLTQSASVGLDPACRLIPTLLLVGFLLPSCGNRSTERSELASTVARDQRPTASRRTLAQGLRFDLSKQQMARNGDPAGDITVEELEALENAEIRAGNGPTPEYEPTPISSVPLDTIHAETAVDLTIHGAPPGIPLYLTLYDVAGRRLHRQQLSPSADLRNVQWVPSSSLTLRTGTYYLHLSAGSFTATRRVTIIR